LRAEGTKFGFTEVRLGLLPAVIARFVLARIGPGYARPLFVSGSRFATDRALAIGLIDQVVPADELDTAVNNTAAELLRCGPQAVAGSKALIRTVAQSAPAEARDYAIEAIASARTGPEGQEGLRAFLDKRRPDWSA
jgi:methylglutaconyl-CoA hydratase